MCYRAILVQLVTEEGFNLAVAGLCAEPEAGRQLQQFGSLSELRFVNRDIVAVDCVLAEGVARVATPSLIAAGAAVRIPSKNGSYEEVTGGVIGDPRSASGCAMGSIEPVNDGLWMYSRPGGPSFVVSGTRDDCTAAWAVADSCAQLGAVQRGRKLEEYFKAIGSQGYLIVCDGCADGGGLVAAGDSEQKFAAEV